MKGSSNFRLLVLASAASTCNCLLSPTKNFSTTNFFGYRTDCSSTKLSFYNDFRQNSDDEYSMTKSDLARIQSIRDRYVDDKSRRLIFSKSRTDITSII